MSLCTTYFDLKSVVWDLRQMSFESRNKVYQMRRIGPSKDEHSYYKRRDSKVLLQVALQIFSI